MGMLTKFRSRLPTINLLTKLESTARTEKTPQTVCLLSIVFLLPYLARGHTSLLVDSVGFVYSCLVLPMVISANYRYPISSFRDISQRLREQWILRMNLITLFLWKIYSPVDRLENGFLRLHNIGIMINQMTFFGLCDAFFLPDQRVTCLYTLMFYNVIAYCVSYIKELVEKEDWSPYVNITEHSNIKHLAMSATKIVLEWTKAITFIITVVFMLLVFGLEQGLEHYKPTLTYSIITLLYYATTEKVFVDLLLSFLTYLQLPVFENLESLWIPVVLRSFTIVISSILSITIFVFGPRRLAILGLYLNVYLRSKEMYLNSLKHLNTERAILTQYRYATMEELSSFDDVCAVCLSSITLARITPCHHLFHGDCLRQCLKTSNQCPMCKRKLKFD